MWPEKPVDETSDAGFLQARLSMGLDVGDYARHVNSEDLVNEAGG